MKIAKFNTGFCNSEFISTEEAGESCVKYSGWVRITEYIEVEFPPLPTTVVVEGRLKQIDSAEQELREKFQQKLNELANERGKLLSLTNESAS